MGHNNGSFHHFCHSQSSTVCKRCFDVVISPRAFCVNILDGKIGMIRREN